MGTLANSEDPDEMQQIAAFNLGLHCLVSWKWSFETEVHLNLKSLTCDPLICTMNHPSLIVSSYMEEFISLQKVKRA